MYQLPEAVAGRVNCDVRSDSAHLPQGAKPAAPVRDVRETYGADRSEREC